MKKCCTCKVEKPLIEFNKRKLSKDGYNNQCKICKRQYRIKNIEKCRQRSKQFRINNPEYGKQWLIDKPDYMKQWYQTPHGKLVRKVKDHKHRMLKIQNTPSGKHFTSADIILKLKLQHSKCIYCKISIKAYYEVDHIIPLVKGGSNEASNIQLLCKQCNGNGGKGSKDAIEYAKKFNMIC